MNIYKIHMDNYQDNYDVEYYHNKINALARMKELWNEAQDKEEIEGNWTEEFSFFDPSYNEYSTYITLIETTLEALFSD